MECYDTRNEQSSDVTFGGDYRFDLDLPKGHVGEQQLAGVLGDTTIEVKRDFQVGATGNVAVEYRCRGEDSGILTSEAEWWAFVLSGEQYRDEVIILIRKRRLLDLLSRLWTSDTARVVSGGDDGASRMVLVPVEVLLKAVAVENETL